MHFSQIAVSWTHRVRVLYVESYFKPSVIVRENISRFLLTAWVGITHQYKTQWRTDSNSNRTPTVKMMVTKIGPDQITPLRHFSRGRHFVRGRHFSQKMWDNGWTEKRWAGHNNIVSRASSFTFISILSTTSDGPSKNSQSEVEGLPTAQGMKS